MKYFFPLLLVLLSFSSCAGDCDPKEEETEKSEEKNTKPVHPFFYV